MRNGKVKVERVVCAIDCGVAVNPDVGGAQMEGCIGFALGAMYYSQIDIQGGRALQRNFNTYRSLRIHEMPPGRGPHRAKHGGAKRSRRARSAAARVSGGQRDRPTWRSARPPHAADAIRAGRDLRFPLLPTTLAPLEEACG